MSAQVPHLRNAVFALVLAVFCSAAFCYAATVDIHPGQNITTIVAENPAGTTFVIYPGTYRLTKPIVPKQGDVFTGQTACAPPKTACPAILSGSIAIGSKAKFNGTNYEVSGMTQQNKPAVPIEKEHLCDTVWQGCIYPEDLFFDGVPLKHLNSATLPPIATGQWWFDYPNNTIYFHDNPSGHTVETSVVPNAFGGSANDVTIQYLTVKEFASLYPVGAIGESQGANPQTKGANWIVQHNEMLLNHGWGVRVAYNIHILNNYIHNNGQAGIGGGLGTIQNPTTQSMMSGIVIQGNLITYNDFAHFNPDFGAGGIKTGATAGIVIRGNTIQHNEGSAVHFDDDSMDELLDGNIITDNTDSDGVNQEMGVGGTTIYRNNILARNGTQVNDNYFTGQLTAHASPNVDAYCNVLEVPAGPGVNGWVLAASNRGDSPYPPFGYLATTGGQFHHNTLIWDAKATGATGYWQVDAANQPNFWEKNAKPDYNEYHVPAGAKPMLVFDDNNSQKNARKTFAEYQSTGADTHGSFDNNYDSGYPTVAITSPKDQTSFSNSITIDASASDTSGINRVEFYVDWALKTTVAGPPYTYNFASGSSGSHVVTAMAYSNAGIRNCFAVTLKKQ
jgi:hypothetical protein